jgi:hypothetical protein
MNARTYGYGNQHVERVAIGPGAKAVANACGAAGVPAGKRRCLSEEGCHEYRIDRPPGDTVFCLTPGRDSKRYNVGFFHAQLGWLRIVWRAPVLAAPGVEAARHRRLRVPIGTRRSKYTSNVAGHSRAAQDETLGPECAVMFTKRTE